MNPARRRALTFAAAMGGTALLAAIAQPQRRFASPVAVDLDTVFPLRPGRWRLSGAMNAFVRPTNNPTYRIYEQVLERTYVDELGWPVMLSVAYGGNQADGLELHRPELCYRFGGFSLRGRRPDVLQVADRALPIARLVAEKPGRPEPITYWLTLGGAAVEDAAAFRLKSLEYAVKRQIVDGLLVRVSSIDPLPDRAFAKHDRFISDVLAALTPAARNLVLGAA
jgi:EpsI family protein